MTRMLVAALALCLTAPALACGPYGGGPQIVVDSKGNPVARFDAEAGTVEKRVKDKWKPIRTELQVQYAAWDQGSLRIQGWAECGLVSDGSAGRVAGTVRTGECVWKTKMVAL